MIYLNPADYSVVDSEFSIIFNISFYNRTLK